MTDTSEQLLPCPFCGGAPTIGFSPRPHADISCQNHDCPVIVETDVGVFGDAVKMSNTRTPRQLDAEVVDRVLAISALYTNEKYDPEVTMRLSDLRALLAALA